MVDNPCLSIAEIIPFGDYIYNYYKIMIFISKNEFHVRMMQKFIVKADPDVLGEFLLGLFARLLIRVMYKACMILKKCNLPVSSSDFKLTQEIMEFLEAYHPHIIRTYTNINNTSMIDSSFISCEQEEMNDFLIKKKEEEEKKILLKKKEFEEVIRKKQENFLQEQLKLFEIYALQNDSLEQKLSGDQNQIRNNTQIEVKDNNQANLKQIQIEDNHKLKSIKEDQQLDFYQIQSQSFNYPQRKEREQQLEFKFDGNRAGNIKEQYQQKLNQEIIADKLEKGEEDDTMNNIDFNDSSSKHDDSSEKMGQKDFQELQGERIVDSLATVEKQYNRILPESLMDDLSMPPPNQISNQQYLLKPLEDNDILRNHLTDSNKKNNLPKRISSIIHQKATPEEGKKSRAGSEKKEKQITEIKSTASSHLLKQYSASKLKTERVNSLNSTSNPTKKYSHPIPENFLEDTKLLNSSITPALSNISTSKSSSYSFQSSKYLPASKLRVDQNRQNILSTQSFAEN